MRPLRHQRKYFYSYVNSWNYLCKMFKPLSCETPVEISLTPKDLEQLISCHQQSGLKERNFFEMNHTDMLDIKPTPRNNNILSIN